MIFTVASGATFSETLRVIAGHAPRLAIFVGSVLPSTVQTFMQTSPSSGGPWADLARVDGSGVVHTVTSGTPGAGLSPPLAEPFARLRFSAALTESTSVRASPLAFG